jgi:hypothetical protein
MFAAKLFSNTLFNIETLGASKRKERKANWKLFEGESRAFRWISRIHTCVNILALIRKRSVFLSSRAGIFTKV